jgi:RecJ-like exonuclease
MGKPQADDGHVKIRAKEYVCPSCNHTVSKEEFEPTLTMNIQYTCPKCKNVGETTTNYKLKSFLGTKAYVFQCGKCGEKIGITKKMKDVKKK